MTGIIEAGDYLVQVHCPWCKRQAEVPAVVERVLKVKGSEGSLSATMTVKAVPHDCRQQTIDDEQQTLVDVQTGEIHEVGRGVRL